MQRKIAQTNEPACLISPQIFITYLQKLPPEVQNAGSCTNLVVRNYVGILPCSILDLVDNRVAFLQPAAARSALCSFSRQPIYLTSIDEDGVGGGPLNYARS